MVFIKSDSCAVIINVGDEQTFLLRFRKEKVDWMKSAEPILTIFNLAKTEKISMKGSHKDILLRICDWIIYASSFYESDVPPFTQSSLELYNGVRKNFDYVYYFDFVPSISVDGVTDQVNYSYVHLYMRLNYGDARFKKVKEWFLPVTTLQLELDNGKFYESTFKYKKDQYDIRRDKKTMYACDTRITMSGEVIPLINKTKIASELIFV
jgi:hypothetical protein